jgi:hypothetical protein
MIPLFEIFNDKNRIIKMKSIETSFENALKYIDLNKN